MVIQFMRYKDIAKVGKGILADIAGLCQNSKVETIVDEIDFNSCPVKCPFKQFDIEEKRNVCINHCPHNKVTKTPKVTYMNERHKYHIRKVENIESNRLSKFQLLQFLSYHFLGVDSKGYVSFISTKQLAEKLGCTVRTIRNNNKQLVKLGLIHFSSNGSDLFNVKIIGYDKYHLTKKEGGTGYVQMTKSFIEALFGMENVNSIRLAIRSLIRFDDDIEVKKGETCFYSYNDIKSFLPSHINHKKIIVELMENTKEIFDFHAHEDGLFIYLQEEFNGKIQKDKIKDAYSEELTTVLKAEKLIVSPDDIDDLAQLSMEYGGTDIVIESIKIYKKFIDSDKTPDFIENIGGFIRTTIKKNFIHNNFKNVA